MSANKDLLQEHKDEAGRERSRSSEAHARLKGSREAGSSNLRSNSQLQNRSTVDVSLNYSGISGLAPQEPREKITADA